MIWPSLKPGIDRLTLKSQNAEYTFVHAPEGFRTDKAFQRLNAERKIGRPANLDLPRRRLQPPLFRGVRCERVTQPPTGDICLAPSRSRDSASGKDVFLNRRS